MWVWVSYRTCRWPVKQSKSDQYKIFWQEMTIQPASSGLQYKIFWQSHYPSCASADGNQIRGFWISSCPRQVLHQMDANVGPFFWILHLTMRVYVFFLWVCPIQPGHFSALDGHLKPDGCDFPYDYFFGVGILVRPTQNPLLLASLLS
jgi:hypothetical protein